MYWQEDTVAEAKKVPDRVVDMVFKTDCRALPTDHAYLLSQAIAAALPWFADEPHAGMHIIHGADSGNGWNRPQGADQLMYLTRRTRLELRVPVHRIDDVLTLSGHALDVDGNRLLVGSGQMRPLSRLKTLYSHYLIADSAHSEEEFLAAINAELERAGIRARKLLPGLSRPLQHPQGDWFTRSLMIADMEPEDALQLQEHGLGPGRKMGCGLFIPHKSIKNTVPEA